MNKILVMPAMIEEVMQWEVPNSPSNIRSFLGFSGYYQSFIHHISKIDVPLACLMKKSVDFRLGPEQQAAFDTLRRKLCEAPVLTLPKGIDNFVVSW